MRLAAVDFGSNSTRLLVADVGEDGGIVEIARRSTVTRLGQGLEAAGHLAPEATARVEAELREIGAVLREHDVQRAVGVMTSAVRDAADGPAFLERVRGEHGIEARVLQGEEEAELSFAGATADRRGADGDGPLLVSDVGGGSTEMIVGRVAGGDDAPDGVAFRVSAQVGVVRHGERHLHHDPPRADEVEALSSDVRAALEAAVPADVRRAVADGVAVAGTATSCAAIAQALEPYDPARVHGYRLHLAQIDGLLAELAGMTEERRRAVPGLDPARAPTIVAGCVVLAEVLRLFGLHDVEVSEHDILHGTLLAARRGAW